MKQNVKKKNNTAIPTKSDGNNSDESQTNGSGDIRMRLCIRLLMPRHMYMYGYNAIRSLKPYHREPCREVIQITMMQDRGIGGVVVLIVTNNNLKSE